MNLVPPPEVPQNMEDDKAVETWIREQSTWMEALYEFLKFPTFELLKFVPRSDEGPLEDGTAYYDSDDNKLKCHNGTAYQDTY